jgi:hypothetical protein
VKPDIPSSTFGGKQAQTETWAAIIRLDLAKNRHYAQNLSMSAVAC